MVVAVDTNIVVNALCNNSPAHLQVVSLVASLPHLKFALDEDRCIDTEYRNNCQRSEYFKSWYRYILEKAEVVNGRLEKKHVVGLKKLGCHERSDHVLVAVAYHSDKYLVTEDSDFGKGNKRRAQQNSTASQYFEDTLGLTFHDADEARKHLPRVGEGIPA